MFCLCEWKITLVSTCLLAVAFALTAPHSDGELGAHLFTAQIFMERALSLTLGLGQ